MDSFSTLVDNYFHTDDADYKINTLFFFHVGQYGREYDNPKTYERANNRYGITCRFAKEMNMDSLMMNTNMFAFYKPVWEYDAGIFCRISSVLVFQKALRRYYISNAVSYREVAKMDFTSRHSDMAEWADSMVMPLLSTEATEIICDGAQYLRSEKTRNIADNRKAWQHLNVCVDTSDTHTAATNCGRCSKCLRTMMALDSVGALENFRAVFDVSAWKELAFRYKCEQVVRYRDDAFAQDNVDFSRRMGKPLPNYFVAQLVVKYYWLRSIPQRVIRKVLKLLREK